MRKVTYGVLGGLVGMIVCGVVGFAIGFFGPIIFTPESNQGPLLGIFGTGPLGAGIGLVGGALWGVVAGSRADRRGPG